MNLRLHQTSARQCFCPAALAVWLCILCGAFTARALELPAESPETNPVSDREETGALTDMVPDYVDPLTLPGGEAGAPSSQSPSAWAGPDLFPSELWSGEQTQLPSPDFFPEPAPDAPLDDSTLPPEVMTSSFGAVPPPPLHDPQRLLAQAQASPLEELIRVSLNARGTFQTSVVLLRPSQQIPVAINPSALLQSWHGDQKGLLVLFFLGRPERTQAFFSPAVRRQHRSEDLRQVIDFGVREASRMATPLAQLQRFCYKTAIRLDRLHRQGIVAPTDEPLPPTAAAAPPASLWWAFAIGVHAAGAAVALIWWWRRRVRGRQRPGTPVLLPAQEFVTRLGAPHCGGTAAVMPFGAVSP